ncbi:MAG: flagellar motor protein MotB [Sphingobacteriales bacterium]|nr:MAG: flagellar motor protein MotB [Sphingobacteriales bacterium]
MKKIKVAFAFLAVLVLVSSCVAKKKFLQSEKSRMNAQDSLKMFVAKAGMLEEDTTQLGIRFRTLMNEKNFLEESSSSEKQYLSSELTSKGKELAQKEKLLQEREKRLQELQDIIAKQDQAVNELRNKVTKALVGFKGDELTVEMKNGKVYVSLAEKLLFKSGSAAVDPKGKEALGKLAAVLEKNPDIDIMIEGHTDNVPLIPGKFDDNWDLSVSRATSIVRILTEDNKVEPKRVIAAGRGEFVPVVANDTAEGKSRNRRTEIILSPKLDELFQLLDTKK